MAKVEIVRSFAYKLNAGNYESRDFFCSQKQECEEEEAAATAARLFDFCAKTVMGDVRRYLATNYKQ
jgi:hypothetical protein